MRDFVTSFLENPIKEYHKSYMFRTPLNPPLRCAQSQSKGQRLAAALPRALCRNVPGGERSDHLREDERSPGALLSPLHCSKWWTASAPLEKGRLFVQHDKMGSRSAALKVKKEPRVCHPHI